MTFPITINPTSMSPALSFKKNSNLILPIETNYNWNFATETRAALSEFACLFDHPFWAKFDISGPKRSIHLPERNITIVETLFVQVDEFYAYTAEGVPGIENYKGLFGITETGMEEEIRLTWAFSFNADTPEHMQDMLAINAGAVPVMTGQLAHHFDIIPNTVVKGEN